MLDHVLPRLNTHRLVWHNCDKPEYLKLLTQVLPPHSEPSAFSGASHRLHGEHDEDTDAQTRGGTSWYVLYIYRNGKLQQNLS